VDKATAIAGMILEMAGKTDGKAMAIELLRSGRAEEKMREIIAAQGGDPDIAPEDIAVGDERFTVRSDRGGSVLWINNSSVAEVAKFAGCPKDAGAGILLHRNIGDVVGEGEPLFTIIAERGSNLRRAQERLERVKVMGVGDRMEMLIHEVKERPVVKRSFTLDR